MVENIKQKRKENTDLGSKYSCVSCQDEEKHSDEKDSSFCDFCRPIVENLLNSYTLYPVNSVDTQSKVYELPSVDHRLKCLTILRNLYSIKKREVSLSRTISPSWFKFHEAKVKLHQSITIVLAIAPFVAIYVFERYFELLHLEKVICLWLLIFPVYIILFLQKWRAKLTFGLKVIDLDKALLKDELRKIQTMIKKIEREYESYVSYICPLERAAKSVGLSSPVSPEKPRSKKEWDRYYRGWKAQYVNAQERKDDDYCDTD